MVVSRRDCGFPGVAGVVMVGIAIRVDFGFPGFLGLM